MAESLDHELCDRRSEAKCRHKGAIPAAGSQGCCSGNPRSTGFLQRSGTHASVAADGGIDGVHENGCQDSTDGIVHGDADSRSARSSCSATGLFLSLWMVAGGSERHHMKRSTSAVPACCIRRPASLKHGPCSPTETTDGVDTAFYISPWHNEKSSFSRALLT